MENPRDDEPSLQLLQAIETDNYPRAETSLLRERLQRGSEHLPNLADLSACKHRLQAMRCEYLAARVRAEELELELKEARYVIGRLEKHTRFLQSTLDEMRASRAWKAVEKCSRLRQRISRLFR